MPVSKKRKKDGKPVHRQEAAPASTEHAPVPEQVEKPVIKAAKPSNPFNAQRPMVQRSQRGR
jgi:hypothetical protein